MSLQLGHRMSVDLDFFSDVAYGIIDFGGIEDYLRKSFRYLDHLSDINPGLGKSFMVGSDADHAIKLDIYYNEQLILQNFTDFSIADDDFNPICLWGKYWEFIKEDIEGAIDKYNKK